MSVSTERSKNRLLLYLVTDDDIPWSSMLRVAEAAIDAGVTTIQLRDKRSPFRLIKQKAMELKQLIAKTEVPLIINDHVHIAAEVGANGIHLGTKDLAPSAARRILGHSSIIGWSIESLDQLRSPEITFCDYLAISPVFPTFTKNDTAPALGLSAITSARALTDKPLLGIGGINSDNAPAVIAAGADGICVVSAISRCEDASVATRKLKDLITRQFELRKTTP